MKVIANAKINVYLKVLGKNQNGYHDLDSLMVPITLCDYIEILESDNDEIVGMDIPMESNLIYKALELVRKTYNVNKKIKVIIEKNIPSFAGLGGGSSDAAAMIKALNELWDLKLTNLDMHRLAEKLGSDVPFFIYNKPAIISGRGEKLKIVDIPNIQGILIFSNYKFSTKEVFQNMQEYSKPYIEGQVVKKGTIIDNFYEYVVNDMESGISIYKESAEVFKQKEELQKMGAICASMSGSGSSVFGLFLDKDQEKMNKAYEVLSEKYNKIWKFFAIK